MIAEMIGRVENWRYVGPIEITKIGCIDHSGKTIVQQLPYVSKKQVVYRHDETRINREPRRSHDYSFLQLELSRRTDPLDSLTVNQRI